MYVKHSTCLRLHAEKTSILCLIAVVIETLLLYLDEKEKRQQLHKLRKDREGFKRTLEDLQNKLTEGPSRYQLTVDIAQSYSKYIGKLVLCNCSCRRNTEHFSFWTKGNSLKQLASQLGALVL